MKYIQDIPTLPKRKPDSNKGDFGKILIIGGSRGMIGAPALAANAALRSGAGLVTVAVPRSIQTTVASLTPCSTSIPLPEDSHGLIGDKAIADLIDVIIKQKKFDVIAVGPGLGIAKPVLSLIDRIVRQKIPLVIDADGLNLLASADWHGLLDGPCVITPHPGELSRLLDMPIADIQADRKKHASRTAKLMKPANSDQPAVCLLKGDKTVVTDGERMYFNRTGNPGMATGGTGDILTGMIAALIGQKLDPLRAAILGANVHGLAGDLAAERLGQISVIASDLIDLVPQAFLRAL